MYSFVSNIRSAIQLPAASELPAFIDDPKEFMPKKLPQADICLASGLHKDLLLALPEQLKKAGIKALIAPIEDSNEVPLGVRQQVERRCEELDLEVALPKPFCTLVPEKGKLTIVKFIAETNIGKPEIE